ncbi:alcohol dehydrogenase [Fusarium oxysporum f. sp. pisi HDV247]|uniref:L-arabinitol 4-dehydrogenase n=1 Tax=Fusarium oxysporum f. sp. pisi HDV247 TaxID=1080344 RepID=W9NND6_FUSOX|nr:alcohol dehydrogenase [Fusarium oxysporum f. sp. pisi HDV247]
MASEALSNSAAAKADQLNPCLTVTADHRIKMEEAPILEPGVGEVLLHVRATGICGSDLHFWKHGAIGSLTVDGDCILGHEAAGVVLARGPGVDNLEIGDRVAIEPGVPCGQCFLCSGGRPNLCEDVHFSGVYPHNGTIQRYKVHQAKFTHKLPDSLSFASAALLEPFSVALHALRTTPVNVGSPVAVFGAGPIGLLTMAAARASGAHPIVITDIDEGRLSFAKIFEPNCLTYRVDPTATPELSANRIRDLFEHEGGKVGSPRTEYDMPQLVLECTGFESSIATASYTVRRGGCINVVGVSSKPLANNIPFMHLSLAEIQLRFINRYHDTWPAAIRAMQGSLVDRAKMESLVTDEFSLENAAQALEFAANSHRRKDGRITVKIQIVDPPLKELPRHS